MRPLAILASVALVSVPTFALAQSETVKFVSNDGAEGDLFGRGLAIDGTFAVVGAYGDDAPGTNTGSAYVFDTITGQQLAKLVANDGAPGDAFGWSVDISGSVVVVGSSDDDDHGTSSGSAYLFDAVTGIQTAKLVPGDGGAWSEFGRSVAICGGLVLVGASADDSAGQNAGTAYLFDAATGVELWKLMPNDPRPFAGFGISVALSGTIALVGAFEDDQQGPASGSAYLFDVTTGTQLAKLLPVDGVAYDRFGWSVAIDGPLALVGAHKNNASGVDSGAAYLFDVASATQISKVLPPDGTPGARFGISVALQGTDAIVGAFLDNANGDDSGSAYMIDLATGETLRKLLPSDGAPADLFGISVALSGQTAIVGAYFDDDNGSASGSAYAFHTPGNGNSGGSFCSGDGAGAQCPCGANGNPGEGCLNSTGVSGASLQGSGRPSISSDTFWLDIYGVPPNVLGLLVRGGQQAQGGLGAILGDGLLCMSGQLARSQVQLTVGGNTSFTNFHGSPFGTWSFGPAAHTYYQFWYRDSQNTCSGLGFNFSNAWAVLWLP